MLQGLFFAKNCLVKSVQSLFDFVENALLLTTLVRFLIKLKNASKMHMSSLAGILKLPS